MTDRLWLLLGAFVAVLAVGVFAGFRPAAAETRVLWEIAGAQVTPGMVQFYPGVFRADAASGKITGLCIPSDGVWVRVERARPACPLVAGTGRPLPALEPQIGAAQEDVASLVVRNFGVTSAEWREGRAGRGHPALRQIASAVDVRVQGKAVGWRFDSALLPDALRVENPGSGTHFHLGIVYSNRRTPFVLERPGEALLIETRLAMPELAVTGGATAGVTIGMVMQIQDVSGQWRPVTFVVDLFRSLGGVQERMASDGRNAFAESPLNRDARFLVPVRGNLLAARWAGGQDFAFRLDTATLRRLLEAFNDERARHGEPALLTDPGKLKLKSVTLRNELRGLDKGRVLVAVEAEYLRISRVSR